MAKNKPRTGYAQGKLNVKYEKAFYNVYLVIRLYC